MDDDNAGLQVARQRADNLFDGAGPSGRCSQKDKGRCWIASNGRRVLGGRQDVESRRIADELADGLDFGQQGGGPLKSGRAQAGRIDGVEGAMSHGFVNLVNVSGHRRRHDQDGARPGGHDLSRCLHAVHTRHEQVHEDQVRTIFARQHHGLGAVSRQPGYFQSLPGLYDAPQRLPGQSHVVDDADSHSLASPIRSCTAFRNVWS